VSSFMAVCHTAGCWSMRSVEFYGSVSHSRLLEYEKCRVLWQCVTKQKFHVCCEVHIYVVVFQCHHMSLMDFVASPPDCGQTVTDF
jgi:hypothetical protein